MKRFLFYLGIAVAVLCAACNYEEIKPPQIGEGGRTFYVSKSLGSDLNDGLSEDAPFKSITQVNNTPLGPGDHVLFKKGDLWACELETPRPTALVPLGRGEKGNPIVIGAYGSGTLRPIIAGSGRQEAVRIEKIEYIRLEGLEITNDDELGWLGNRQLKGTQNRRGVYVNVEHMDYNPFGDYVRRTPQRRSTPAFGAMNGIELVDLYIHDIMGYAIHSENPDANGPRGTPAVPTSEWWNCGGIFMKNSEPNAKGSAIGRAALGEPIGRLVAPLIKDCYLANIGPDAIYADNSPENCWDNGTMEFSFTGARVENTVINYTGGEGINLVNAFWGWEVDHCGLYDLAYDPGGNTWYAGFIYTGNEGVVQNCEVARMKFTGDSHAFDNDQTSFGTGLIQYNYVHDVPGCFLMNWPGNKMGAASTIIRYNIAVNVGKRHPVLMLGTEASNVFAYNNVFYNDDGRPINIECYNDDRAAFVNNVFWSNGATVLDLSEWKSASKHTAQNFIPAYFDYNMYFSPNGAEVVGGKDYAGRFGVNWSDAHRVTGDLGFGSGRPDGVADADDNLSAPGYKNIITGPVLRDLNALAAFFKIDPASSGLYGKGREVTRKEVIDFIWGKRDSSVNQNNLGNAADDSMKYSKESLFDFNAGKDFFGNPVSGTPSVGAHNP